MNIGLFLTAIWLLALAFAVYGVSSFLSVKMAQMKISKQPLQTENVIEINRRIKRTKTKSRTSEGFLLSERIEDEIVAIEYQYVTPEGHTYSYKCKKVPKEIPVYVTMYYNPSNPQKAMCDYEINKFFFSLDKLKKVLISSGIVFGVANLIGIIYDILG